MIILKDFKDVEDGSIYFQWKKKWHKKAKYLQKHKLL